MPARILPQSKLAVTIPFMSKIIIYVTCGDRGEAEKISRTLVERRLVACANILQPHGAVYWWQGKVEAAEEVAVILKTPAEKFSEVEQAIKDLHSYDVPCIVAWPIERGYAPFLDWIEAETA